jgi:peptide/nickel transport system substrate-binding protein
MGQPWRGTVVQRQTRQHEERRTNRRRFLGYAGAGGAGLILAACGGGADEARQGSSGQAPVAGGQATSAAGGAQVGAARSGPLRVAMSAPVDFISPNTCSQGGGCGNWRGMTFSGLYETERDYSYKPLMTAPYETNSEFTEYTFKLKPEAIFHNGDKITAEDVAFSVEQALNPDTKYHLLSLLRNVESTQVIDAATVRMKLKQPDVILVRYLPSIVQKRHFAKVGSHEGFAKEPVGAGPWTMSDVRLRESVALRRWDKFYGTKPAIEQVAVREIPDNNTRVSALLAGEVDFVRDVPPNLAKQIDDANGYKTYRNPTATTLFVKFNTFAKPFDDVRVRRALYHAVDIQGILKSIVKEAGGPTVGFLPETVTGPDAQLKAYEYDPKKAKEMLASAGHPDGFSTDLVFPIGRYVVGDQVAQAIAQMWNAVGVRTKVASMDYSAWTSEITTHKLQAPTLQQYSTYFKASSRPSVSTRANRIRPPVRRTPSTPPQPSWTTSSPRAESPRTPNSAGSCGSRSIASSWRMPPASGSSSRTRSRG